MAEVHEQLVADSLLHLDFAVLSFSFELCFFDCQSLNFVYCRAAIVAATNSKPAEFKTNHSNLASELGILKAC